MNFKARLSLAISKFFRKYGQRIFVVLVIWIGVISLNTYFRLHPRQKELAQLQDANAPIMDNTDQLSSKDANKNYEIINEYFTYCNEKNYELAFNMLSKSCRKFVFEDSINNFKTYIDSIFKNTKTFNIQNYSNTGNIFIYVYTVLDDIETTGTTGGYETYTERLTVIKNNDEYEIACNNFIGTFDVYKEAEDSSLKVTVTTEDIAYSRVQYNLTIQNKSSNYVVISDGENSNEVELELKNETRNALNYVGSVIDINPNSTKNVSFVFDKFIDDGDTELKIKLNNVRVYNVGSTDLIRRYSVNIDL